MLLGAGHTLSFLATALSQTVPRRVLIFTKGLFKLIYKPLSASANAKTTIPANLLLVRSTCIVNEPMLLGESTPLLKGSIELWEADARLDLNGVHKNAGLFGGAVLKHCDRAQESLRVRLML